MKKPSKRKKVTLQTPRQGEGLYSQIVAQTWLDPAFKERLLKDPVTTLKEQGLKLPRGISVEIVEHAIDKQSTKKPAKNVFYLHLPKRPASLEKDMDIEQLTRGMLESAFGTCSSNSCSGTGCATGSSNCLCHACSELTVRPN